MIFSVLLLYGNFVPATKLSKVATTVSVPFEAILKSQNTTLINFYRRYVYSMKINSKRFGQAIGCEHYVIGGALLT